LNHSPVIYIVKFEIITRHLLRMVQNSQLSQFVQYLFKQKTANGKLWKMFEFIICEIYWSLTICISQFCQYWQN